MNISIIYLKKKNLKKKNFLEKKIKKNYGRNNLGKIICKHKGGGNKLLYRYIDYWFANYGLNSNNSYILNIFYNPNKKSKLALILYINGLKKGKKVFFLLPKTLKKGNFLKFNKLTSFNIGYSQKLKNFPLGSFIYNIEFFIGKGSTFVRSPGTYGKIISFFKDKVIIKLPSGNLKLISNNCFATLGIVSKFFLLKTIYFKAGYIRHLNKRPVVRGVAMNAYDHPHGGGEGRSRIGIKYLKTPWGKHTLGKKTSKKEKNYFFWLLIIIIKLDMSKFMYKDFFFCNFFLRKQISSIIFIKNTLILPNLLGSYIYIYIGNYLIPNFINKSKIGYKIKFFKNNLKRKKFYLYNEIKLK